MRGTASAAGCRIPGNGITPAHAGNRQMIERMSDRDEDHPRACGEQTKKIPYSRASEFHSMPFSFSLQ